METFTTNEVVALFGLEERRVRKEVEHGVLDAATPPRFSLPSIVYLQTLAKIGFEVSAVEDRKRLYSLILAGMKPMNVRTLTVALSAIAELKLDQILRDAIETIERFNAWKQTLVIDDRILGGEPVFPRTRLAVRRVGAMQLSGASIAEVREDYPYLSSDDIELARIFTRAYPLKGRPREAPAR